MLTLKPSTRLSAAKPSSRRSTPLRPNPSTCQRPQQRRIVAAAGGAAGGPPGFDDRGNPSSDMAGSLKDQQTGTLKDGPANIMADRELESSDTNPSMDPSEKPNLARREGAGNDVSFPLTQDSGLKGSGKGSAGGREGSGMDEAQMQFRSGGESGAESFLRDQSDQSSAQGSDAAGGGSSSSTQRTDPATGLPLNERSHPAARTSGTAIGSAVGAVMGAVGGPVTAAAGAALGASAGRGLTDLLSGTSSKEQAQIYEQGAEPEQLLEEVMGVGSDIKGAAERVGNEINDRTEGALDKAEAAMDDARAKADKRRAEGKDKADDMADDMSKKFDDATSDMKQQTRSRSDESSATGEGGSGSSSKSSGGGGVGGAVLGAAKSAAQKLESATGSIPLPEFPPANKEGDSSGSLGTEGTAEGAFEGASGKEGATKAASKSIEMPSSSSKAAADRAAEGGWGEGADGGMSGKQWVGDWGSEAATSDAASKGLATPAAASGSNAAAGGSSGSSAGGSGLGGLGDAEELVKSDVGVPSQAGLTGDESSAKGWKPEGVGRAGGVAAAGGYGSESVGDAGFSADQQRAGGGGGASLQPASAVGNAGQEIRGPGGNISGGVGAEFGQRADFEAGGGVLDGVAGRVSGIEGVASESLMEGINSLSGVAGASYEGVPGMQGGQGSGQQGSGGMGQQGSAGVQGAKGSDTMPDGVPEGRLRVGGDDAQAAISVDGSESNAAITGDSVAQRIEQMYGITPEASTGVAEAAQYQKEAQQEGGEDHGQSTEKGQST